MFLILYCWVIGTESYAARPEWSSFLYFFGEGVAGQKI